MKDLKEIIKIIRKREATWEKTLDAYTDFLFAVDMSVLEATINSKNKVILSFDYKDNNWIINEFYETGYSDFYQLTSAIKKYLIFNGFNEVDITMHDTEMHIKL